MSKTKEEIIRHRNPQLDNTIELYSQSLVVRDVITAMDEYASQVLSEYKEKLKAECSEAVSLTAGPNNGPFERGYITAMKDAITYICNWRLKNLEHN